MVLSGSSTRNTTAKAVMNASIEVAKRSSTSEYEPGRRRNRPRPGMLQPGRRSRSPVEERVWDRICSKADQYVDHHATGHEPRWELLPSGASIVTDACHPKGVTSRTGPWSRVGTGPSYLKSTKIQTYARKRGRTRT